MIVHETRAEVLKPSFDDTIVFSRSRRVPVDPERMERNRLLQPGAIGPAGPPSRCCARRCCSG